MGIRRLSADGERRYQLALKLCDGDKSKVDVAVDTALSTSNGLTPYVDEFEERFIKLHLRGKVLAKLSWNESVEKQTS